jgi:hypothetical protein
MHARSLLASKHEPGAKVTEDHMHLSLKAKISVKSITPLFF